MNIDSIQNGYVIDHIAPGKGMEIYHMLGLDRADCAVAMIINAPSEKMGTKDIIKVDSLMDMNFDLVGYISPNATVNIIREGQRTEKKYLNLPAKLVNIIRCKNPRCITTTEQEIDHVFELTGDGYRCLYCEAKAPER